MFLTKWKMTDFPNMHLNTRGSVIRCIGIPFKRLEEDYGDDDIIRPTARNYAVTWMFVFRSPWF
jgi:hypothetical protein